ncbi:MAG: RIP metalloprotease RseP [bacterium]|nr:RIP metalloprotease RseP [bacterium]
MTILYFVIALGLLVFIHEFGHFIVAKLSGMRVEKFSLGFGPKIFGFQKGETEYRVSILPLGGYVKLTGEDPASPEANAPDSFNSKPLLSRLGVVVAGPTMNLLLALLLMPIVFMIGKMEPAYLDQKPIVTGVLSESPAATAGFQVGDEIVRLNGKEFHEWRSLLDQIMLRAGEPLNFELNRDGQNFEKSVVIDSWEKTKTGYLGVEPRFFVGNEPVVDGVGPDSPASKAGLQKGDRVVAVNGKAIQTWTEMSEVIGSAKGETVLLTLERQGKSQTVSLSPLYDKSHDKWMIGVQKGVEEGKYSVLKRYSFGEACLQGWSEVKKLTGLTFDVLGRLVTFQLSYKALGGPIRIAQGAAMAAETGLSYFLYFIAFLSLQLGILNILPIPVLDGGHVAYLTLEKIFRKPVSTRIRSIIDQTGLALLLTLMLVVTLNDIDSVWGTSWIVQKIKAIF